MARPDVIFAAGAGKRTERIGDKEVVVGSHSRRPLQTVTPLAEALKLTPVTIHTKGEEQALVHDALGRSGTVLICWQHQNIAAIGNLIVGNNTTVPQSWPEDRYDLIYVFESRRRCLELSPVLSWAAGHIINQGWRPSTARASASGRKRGGCATSNGSG